MNVNTVIEEHFKSINELDTKRRLKLMNDSYAKTVRFVDPFFEVTGISDLEKMYDKLHEKFPQHTFKVVQVDLLKDSARVKWELVNKDKKKVHTGEDIMIFQSGKIQTLYVFIDKE